MAFTPKRKVYILDFADTDLDGLTVRARSLPIGPALELEGLLVRLRSLDTKDTGQASAVIGDLVDAFAKVITSWDLCDDDGVPVPADAAGLLTLGEVELMQLIGAYVTAVATVPAPLVQPSGGGVPSLEASLPMEPLSASLAS